MYHLVSCISQVPAAVIFRFITLIFFIKSNWGQLEIVELHSSIRAKETFHHEVSQTGDRTDIHVMEKHRILSTPNTRKQGGWIDDIRAFTIQEAVPSTSHSASPNSCSNSTLGFILAQFPCLDNDPILNFARKTEEPALFDLPTSRKALSVKNYFVATNSRKTGII